ncbi:putative ribonuclease H-like domain-containing protein [Tanacetum coccineum]
MAELILNENMEKAQTESNLSITSNDINIKLSKEFLVELRKNAYHGWIDEDVIDHIANVLEMIDLIYILKFFCKFYPESYDGEEEMLDEGDNWGIDTLEFISRVNLSFDKHMKVDGRTKKVLFHAWMNESWNKRRMDDSILSSNNTTTDSFFKPYLKTRENNDTKKEDERSRMKRKSNGENLEANNTSMTINDERPNKRMCNAEKFEAIKYSLGPNKEYISVRRFSLDLSRLATTLYSLERSIELGSTSGIRACRETLNYPIWEVIPKGNGSVSVFTYTNGVIKVLPPKTAEEILARERERKARTTLLMALPEDHLAKFHKITENFCKGMGKPSNLYLEAMNGVKEDHKYHGVRVSMKNANQKWYSDPYLLPVSSSNASSSSTQNVVFVFSENTSGTNDVSTAYGASSSSGHNPQREDSSSYIDELIYSFFVNQSSGLQLDHEDLEQLDEFDLKKMDLKWQVAMISMRIKKFYKKTGRKLHFDAKEPVGFDKTKLECYNCHKIGHFAKECRSKGNQDSRRRDAWNSENKAKDSGRRSRKKEEPKALVTLDGDEAEKEKEDLKAKVEKWHNSSKSLNIMLNSQMSVRDKAGIGFGNQIHEGVLSYENEVIQSVFDTRSSDIEDSPVNDRYTEGMHDVPPLLSGTFIPSGPVSNSSVESNESVPTPVANEPKLVSNLKVWSDAPIIKEYESDSDDEHVSLPTKEHEIPSFAFDTVKHVKTPRQTVNEQHTCSQSSKPNKRDWNGLMSKKIRMAKQAELNKQKGRGIVQRENKPVWNIVQRVNHKNQFVPTAVLTRTGIIPVNTARKNFNSQAVLTNTARKVNTVKPIVNDDDPHKALKNKGIVNSGCSRHMAGNKAYLDDYQDYNGGPVAFGGSKGYITGKGKIRTGKLNFKDVCFVKELQLFNLFSVLQMCDKKNKVFFTDTECLVLSPDFKLPDKNQVLLRVPRQNNMYSFNLENIVPTGGLACLIAKATVDESNKWHRRLGHVNFKNLNKLVKGNLVRGLPSKIFQNDHTYVACQKGKQHKASCKAKSVSSISQPLQLLHMDLFGPTSVRSINHKTYCLVITDDFSRFSWVFFLRTKDETSGILKDFIRQIENQLNQKVKTIRCDNGTKFKNRDIIEFCGSKGIKREYSNARTPQQNGVAERKNMTLIEAARTMLADSFLPNTF